MQEQKSIHRLWIQLIPSCHPQYF